jgi:hypothetical protein
MNISNYEDLLSAAAAQAEPQRLLFAFVKADLPEQASSGEQERFARRQGGTLTPVMCVDKLVGELGSFAELVEESRHTGAHWDLAFVTTMSGRDGKAPTSNDAEPSLKMMVAAIESGKFDRFLTFNRAGELVRLQAAH